jgi:hypothetical protein
MGIGEDMKTFRKTFRTGDKVKILKDNGKIGIVISRTAYLYKVLIITGVIHVPEEDLALVSTKAATDWMQEKI